MEGLWHGRLARYRRSLLLWGGIATAIVLALIMTGVGRTESAGQFQFEPLPTSATCTEGGNPAQPFVLPAGYTQTVIASEPQFPDLPDMNTQNETGSDAGRYLYRTHETNTNSAVTVTDLKTGTTKTLAQRADWERFDGIVWTPWGTILAAEETSAAAVKDPEVPQAKAGLVYEFFLNPNDPTKLDKRKGGGDGIAPRPAIGSKSHEGMRFDPQGNLYSISETNPGYIYRFVPDTGNNLSKGQLYALKVTQPTGDRTGEAVWVPLDRASVQVDARDAATAAGATGYNRPEDVETSTSSGNVGTASGTNTLYVAVTGPTGPPDNRVLGVDLREPTSTGDHATAFVYDYVRPGLNTDAQFQWPDNLALDANNNLYITEDKPDGQAQAENSGDDIWVALHPQQPHEPAQKVLRFASLTDCAAEPTGIYFKMTAKNTGDSNQTLFVNVQHRGGDGLDKAVAITRSEGNDSPGTTP